MTNRRDLLLVSFLETLFGARMVVGAMNAQWRSPCSRRREPLNGERVEVSRGVVVVDLVDQVIEFVVSEFFIGLVSLARLASRPNQMACWPSIP